MFTEKIMYAQGGHLYIGSQAAGFTLVDETGVGGDAYHVGNELSIVQAGRYFWLVDGQNALRRVNIDTGVLDQPGPTTAAAIPALSRLLALYRGRLFHGRFAADPYNYYASFSGDFLNYDAADITQSGAFAGNNTQQAGLLGDTLIAMVPYGDVSMVMGMSNSMAVMRGDPKAGGSIDTVSREIGIVRPQAWARDPDGNLYFQSRDGLYVMTPNSAPKPMSRGRLDETLGNIDHSSVKVMLQWDPGELGLKIYLMPLYNTLPTKVVFWEQRKDAFWVDSVAAGVGPTAAAPIAGADKRFVLLGCWDGFLRTLDETALTDDGEAIESFVDYPPMQFNGDMVNSKIVQSRYLFADNGTNFGVTYSLTTATDAVTVGTTDPNYTRTLTLGGYQTLDRHRDRGACAVIRLANSVKAKSWAVERTTLIVAPSGRVRA